MRTPIWVTLGVFLVSFPTLGQGTVLFGNRVEGSVNARVLAMLWPPPATYRPADSRFVVQLFAAPPGGVLAPVGDPVPFEDQPEHALGYIPSVVRSIPTVAPGQPAMVKMVGWHRGLGESYVEALSAGVGGVGESGVVTVPATGSDGATAGPIVGLTSFAISHILAYDPTPEPLVASGFPSETNSVVRWFGLVPTLEWALGIRVVGTRAMVAAGYGGLQVLDLTEVAGPRRVAQLFTVGTQARALAVHGDRVFLATSLGDSGGAGSGLRCIDVSDPAHPRLLGGLSLGGAPRAVAVSDSGDHVFVASGVGGVQVVEVTDPTQPRVVGEYQAGGAVLGLVGVGGLVYVAASQAGMQVVDFTDPTRPRRVGTYASGDSVRAVGVRGALAFVSGRSTGLHVVDVSDPAVPRGVGQVGLVGGAGPLALGDRHVYVQNDWSGSNPFQPGAISAVDIQDPSRPRVVGRVTSAREAGELAIADGHLWVADSLCVTRIPLGPFLRLDRDLSVAFTGARGVTYELQEASLGEQPWTWRPLRQVVGSGKSESLESVMGLGSPGYLLRVVPSR